MITGVAEPSELVIGRPDDDHLTVRVIGRMHPGSSDYWDGNWLISPISANLGSFSAQLAAGLRVDELQTFRHGLELINQQLRGEAVLTSLEPWISLTVACRPNGSLAVTGELDDNPGIGNRLTFAITGIDQTDIPAMLAALSAIERAYPLLGRP
ncbi:hypothetical protein [Micromonospora sp. MA102]|uniref:WapI family immunity protein n=1 Tax=Micromonospora sp. MA102 TaxID=2952755 RepID=UPI0021C630AB|nr:hypothetical protein [Micromonospora sp. MA102]